MNQQNQKKSVYLLDTKIKYSKFESVLKTNKNIKSQH